MDDKGNSIALDILKDYKKQNKTLKVILSISIITNIVIALILK